MGKSKQLSILGQAIRVTSAGQLSAEQNPNHIYYQLSKIWTRFYNLEKHFLNPGKSYTGCMSILKKKASEGSQPVAKIQKKTRIGHHNDEISNVVFISTCRNPN